MARYPGLFEESQYSHKSPCKRGRKTSREEINKDKENLNNAINQLADLTDIYKTHHPITVKYTFFSCAQRIFILQDIP